MTASQAHTFAMNVLHVTPMFYPATHWGGPITSLYGLCNSLAEKPGLKLRVLTTDAMGPRLEDAITVVDFPVRYPAGYDVYFTRRLWGQEIAPALVCRLGGMIRWADVVHLAGVYSFPTIPTLLLCRALGKPVVWSPHGALQRWVGSTRPRVKRYWEVLCNALLVKDKAVLHVTSREEANMSASRIPRADIALIPNGVELPILPRSRDWKVGGLNLLYIGRLDEIKGIENLLDALPRISSGIWTRLTVCGRGNAHYEDELRWRVQRLGLADRVRFLGATYGEEKTRIFFDSDLCVVPSYSENFGMVVAEALAHGVPVIASRGTPWSEVEKYGCGLWVDNSPESLANAIVSMSKKNLEDLGRKGRQWVETDFCWQSISGRVSELYMKLVRKQ